MEHLVVLPSQLAPILRSLRRARGLTQKQLAEKLGITKQGLSDLERKPHKATFERLLRVLGALDVEIVLRQRPDEGGAPW